MTKVKLISCQFRYQIRVLCNCHLTFFLTCDHVQEDFLAPPPPPSIKKYVSPSFLVHTPVHGALAVLKHFALSLTIILPRFLIIPANGIVDIAFTVLYNMLDLSLSAVLLRILLIFQNLILVIFIKKKLVASKTLVQLQLKTFL